MFRAEMNIEILLLKKLYVNQKDFIVIIIFKYYVYYFLNNV